MINKLEIFKEELDLIKNDEIRKLCEYVISETPDYYFSQPASTSGLFHPLDELGECGKIIHHKKIVKLCEQSARRYGLETNELLMDIVRASCLIHDMPFCFYWCSNQNKYRTNYQHANKNANFIYEYCEKEYGEDVSIWPSSMYMIIHAVYFHMGKWGYYKLDEYEHIEDIRNWLFQSNFIDEDFDIGNYYHEIISSVQEADFYASRRMINIDLNMDAPKG